MRSFSLDNTSNGRRNRCNSAVSLAKDFTNTRHNDRGGLVAVESARNRIPVDSKRNSVNLLRYNQIISVADCKISRLPSTLVRTLRMRVNDTRNHKSLIKKYTRDVNYFYCVKVYYTPLD